MYHSQSATNSINAQPTKMMKQLKATKALD